MHHKKLVMLSALVMLMAGLFFINASPARAAAAATCAWKTVTGANPGPLDNVLTGVSARSTKDVWAVGGYYGSSGYLQPLTEHWNGKTWRTVSSPGGSFQQLNAVSADAANDAWAVGEDTNPYLSVIEHWNGSVWSTVVAPSISGDNVLNGVVALSTTDAWAIGVDYNSSNIQQTLIENWNGSQWQIIPSPNPGAYGDDLYGIAATSSTNIWAVGTQFTDSSGTQQTLIEHWNGTQWSAVSSPSLGSIGNYLTSVTALAQNNAWAVGTGSNRGQTLIEHWNGSQWQIVSSPTPVSGENQVYLDGIAGQASNLWAVGTMYFNSLSESFIEHWNGTAWSLVTNPNPGSVSNALYAVAVAPGSSKTWTVGSTTSTNSGGLQPMNVLVETHC